MELKQLKCQLKIKEVKYCKYVMKKEFNKPLKMTKDDKEGNFKKLKNVIFATKNILLKIFELETIVILHVNIEVLLIENVI